jgi:hypothetical protein
VSGTSSVRISRRPQRECNQGTCPFHSRSAGSAGEGTRHGVTALAGTLCTPV